MRCTVVRETLENRGVLGQLRARIRAEVFSALNDPTDSQPAVSRENFLINELIREYLDFNHYIYASSVLSAGLYTGLPWEWEFPWEFPWKWEWDGYGNCDEFPWELWEFCGNF